jgi:surface polysaccharide O-acyltransferase-like enzyme
MNRIASFDFVRTIAILFVIAIHACARLNAAIVVESNSFGIIHWGGALWHIIYTAVPLFVMLSGALLLGKDEPINLFFKKRLQRILIPFLVWSFVLGTFLYYKENHMLSGCLTWIVKSTLTGGIHTIYWYIYLILGLYLITPLLRKIIQHSTSGLKIYFLALLLVIYILGQYLPCLQLFHRFVSDNLLYSFYFVAGYVISINVEQIKRYYKLLVVLCICVYIVGMLIFMINAKILDSYRIIETILVFTLIIASPWQFNRIAGGVRLISTMSYGIYLTHFAIISLLSGLSFLQYINAAIYPLVAIAMVLPLNMIMLQILKKMGLGKWVM